MNLSETVRYILRNYVTPIPDSKSVYVPKALIQELAQALKVEDARSSPDPQPPLDPEDACPDCGADLCGIEHARNPCSPPGPTGLPVVGDAWEDLR